MTPQSSFMILAPIRPARIGAMRALLATMNSGPGTANPDNPMIPFSRFDNLHSARLVLLDDQTIGDPEEFYGVQRPDPPIYLAFLGDFDGTYDAFISLLVQHAAPGLRRIFSLCEGFSADEDVRAWMIAHETRPSAYYCNYVGRTVQQTREEERLRRALRRHLDRSPEVADGPPGAVHESLRRFVRAEKAAGRLTLTPPAPTPLGWTVRHAFDWAILVLLVIVLVVTLPLTLVPLAILALVLHAQESSAPEFAPPPDHRLAMSLAVLEDYDVTNQFSAMGPWKPGWLRALIIPPVLWIINLTASTIYTKGRLTRIHTIHFARWVYLDNRTRLLFASVYDGSLESYNEDFINKVAIGLNIVFGNGVGYPRTAWLITKGCKDEQKFKYFLRRHELPTDVWYNAHPGLTAFDLLRNSTIRNGLEKVSLSQREAREWVALL
jgi:hypothetical protein